MELHPTVLRYLLEEKYCELIIAEAINPDELPEEETLIQMIVDHSNEIIELGCNNEQLLAHCTIFLKCIRAQRSYTNSILVRYHMKQLYNRLISEGVDPEDRKFESIFINEMIQYEPVLNTISFANESPRYKSILLEQTAQSFLKNIKSGIISVPSTYPYQNYMPSTLAKSILLKYVGA